MAATAATALGRLTRQLSEERASLLAKEAIELANAGDVENASRKLRAAAALGHDNADVQAAFLTLHSGQATSPLVDLCRRYAQYHDKGAGESAVAYLRSPEAASVGLNARECLKLILESNSTELSDAQDSIIAELARRSLTVRTYFATELEASTTEFFDNVYDRGDHAANCLRTVVLDTQLWSSEETRLRVEDDLFQLFLAKLMESGHDHDGRALKGIALLLLADAERLHYFIDEDAAEALLVSLDFRLPPDVRGQATLVYSKFLEVSDVVAQTYFIEFVTKHVTRGRSDDLLLAFAAGASIFPVAPAAVAQLFLTENFLPSIIPALPGFAGTRVHDSFLALLNAACIDGACRTAIQKNCATWLSHIVSNGVGKQPAMAAIILAKLRTSGTKGTEHGATMADHDVSDLVDLFQKNLLAEEEKNMSDSIEGLAYTSLKPEVKEKLAADRPTLIALFSTLEDNTSQPEIVIGGLSIIANLTHYQPTLSDEQKRITQLKAYANASKPTEANPLESDDHVKARCTAVVDAGVVSLLVKINKGGSSPTMAHLTDTILLSLSRNPKDRGRIAQQGAVRLLITHCLRSSRPPQSPKLLRSKSPAPQAAHTHANAAHALARILISLNPAHVFPSNTPPHITDAVISLLPLIKKPPEDTPALSDSAPRDLLPVFECLLALTNLASSPDQSAANTIIRSCFDEIEDIQLGSNDMLRRAATELICNLVAYPSGIGKFADGSRRAQERLRILVAMADVEDLKTRTAAGGGVAMLTEYEPVIQSLLDVDDKGRRSVEIFLDMISNQEGDVGLVHRGLAILVNLVNVEGEMEAKAIKTVREASGEEKIKSALRKIKDPAVLQIGIEVLKQLKQTSS